eukprot:COSAG04_NODE_2220_length_4505_cov_9.015887_3_plen_67_part_00
MKEEHAQAVEAQLGSAVMGLPDGLKWIGKPAFNTALARALPGVDTALAGRAWTMYKDAKKDKKKKK